jgi:aspartyl-tRNA(Asn)/glutamyl-tRNA(Gln) amidotransferase subunit C
MDINREVISNIAKLARVSLSDDELDALVQDVVRILDYFAMISDIDTSNVPETTHVGGLTDKTSADTVAPSFPAKVLLSGAPDSEGTWFKTPRILEE